MASKRSLSQRKADNKGVRNGTVRVGADGKQMRQYNKKTGRWTIVKKAQGAPRMSGTTRKPAAPKSSSSSFSIPGAQPKTSNSVADAARAAQKRGQAIAAESARYSGLAKSTKKPSVTQWSQTSPGMPGWGRKPPAKKTSTPRSSTPAKRDFRGGGRNAGGR